MHIPGPLKLDTATTAPVWEIKLRGHSADPLIDGVEVAKLNPHLINRDDNARLLCASYNSYDKHCGPRAIECAENDLLGDLLEACKAANLELNGYENANNTVSSVSLKLRAAIAKAEGR